MKNMKKALDIYKYHLSEHGCDNTCGIESHKVLKMKLFFMNFQDISVIDMLSLLREISALVQEHRHTKGTQHVYTYSKNQDKKPCIR